MARFVWRHRLVAAATLAVLLGSPALALAVPTTQPAGESRHWQASFDSELPYGTEAGAGAAHRQRIDAPAGDACLRFDVPRQADDDRLLVFPLPMALQVPADGSVSAWVRTGSLDGPVRLRWCALDERRDVLFQACFEIDGAAGWKRLDWPLYQWRWGARQVGDWSRVRALALKIDSPVQRVWLDEVAIGPEPPEAAEPPRPDRPAASTVSEAEWLADLAFPGRAVEELIEPDLMVLTDRLGELGDEDLLVVRREHDRVHSWCEGLFALDERAAAGSSKVVIFGSRLDAKLFFRRLAEAWRCRIAPPKLDGYTVQDIAACVHDPLRGPEAPVILHELTHTVAARRLGLSTTAAEHAWLQEALANYLQVCVHPDSLDSRTLLDGFSLPAERRAGFPPLSRLLARRPRPGDYPQLASLAAYLAAERLELLRGLTAGLADQRPLESVLAEYGTDLETLDRQWRTWGRQLFAYQPLADALAEAFPKPAEWQPIPTADPAE